MRVRLAKQTRSDADHRVGSASYSTTVFRLTATGDRTKDGAVGSVTQCTGNDLLIRCIEKSNADTAMVVAERAAVTLGERLRQHRFLCAAIVGLTKDHYTSRHNRKPGSSSPAFHRGRHLSHDESAGRSGTGLVGLSSFRVPSPTALFVAEPALADVELFSMPIRFRNLLQLPMRRR